MSTYQSTCLCGKFKLELTGPPIIAVICHCSLCRRHTGGAFSHMVSFPTPNIKFLNGNASELSVYKSSDHLARKNCSVCNGLVLHEVPAHNLTAVSIWSISDSYIEGNPRSEFIPRVHLFYADRVVDVKDGIPKMKTKTPEDGLLPE